MIFNLILYVILIISPVFALPNNNGKVCKSMDIRNFPEHLDELQDCKVIDGNLKIVLMERTVDFMDYYPYTFPKLREINEYLLVYRLNHLRSLSRLFPNLVSINGKKLFHGYALALYDLPDLKEIGLTSLSSIGNGSVRVQYCPEICYVNTVNWEAIGALRVDVYNKTSENCRPCPGMCRGYCWNLIKCQRIMDDKCHPQCIGCTEGNSSSHCNVCKYYNDNGVCVHSCPKDKLIDEESAECRTREECKNIKHFIFKDKYCVSECPPKYKNNNKNGTCDFIYGKRNKTCDGNLIDNLDVLKIFLNCTIVNGPLQIRWRDPNLEPFLETYLGKIIEITGNLKIGRSKGIRSLEFLKSLKIIGGKAQNEDRRYGLFVYKNENLQKLWDFDKDFSLTIKNGTMTFYNNPLLCVSEIETLVKSTKFNVTFNDTMKLFSHSNRINCDNKNITINVTQKTSNNATLKWNWNHGTKNESTVGYVFYYAQTSKLLTIIDDACNLEKPAWNSVFLLNNNSVFLKKLVPYTNYSYFIKYLSDTTSEQQTPIYYFETLPDDPTNPVNPVALVLNDSSINLTWAPPIVINGNFSHYNITMLYEPDYQPLAEQRNYCLYPHVFPPTCTCNYIFFLRSPSCTTDQEMCPITSYKCTTGEETCPNTFYETFTDNINDVARKNIKKRSIDSVGNNSYNTYETITTTKTFYLFQKLKPFGLYIFFLTACNRDRDRCGSVESVSNRTKMNKNVDNITDISVQIEQQNVYVTWVDPQETNSLLVAFHIELKNLDVESAEIIKKCITAGQFEKMGRKYKISDLSPGSYAIRVQAVSLAKPEQFSPWKKFKVSSNLSWISIFLIILFFLIVLSLVILYCWHKKKRMYLNNHLHSYSERNWEIDRNDVEIIKELTMGSFGTLYRGKIKSKQYPCTVKIINDIIPDDEILLFKTLTRDYHVIKIQGMVSNDHTRMVIMELMELGDLKSYLQRCRGPFQNLTINKIYRMAAEIADGMAYLGSKGFIHKDLAARNCMVTNGKVKISPLPICEDIYNDDYYQSLPIRWMAPESLSEGGFTINSNVWSYGVVLWELLTLAEQPYQEISDEEVSVFVQNRGKLTKPRECPDFLSEIMDNCLMWCPNDRPNFFDIVDKLVGHIDEDFRWVSFCYSYQGMEHDSNTDEVATSSVTENNFYTHYGASSEEINLCAGDGDSLLF